MYHSRLIFVLFQFILLAGCQRFYQPQNLRYAGYQVIAADGRPDSIQHMLRPYSDSVLEVMTDTIGVLDIKIEKKLPDGTLGNFLADAYLQMARLKWNKDVSVAFMNHGGIRVSSIPAGPLIRTNIYEVMPFDNEMVIMEVNGKILKEYLDLIASDGGGGVAGIRFIIKDKKATNIFIADKPLHPAAKYLMVNSDYVVNGGGGFNGFKDLPRVRSGYLLRDAILDYVAIFKEKNIAVPISSDKRISVEK